LLFALAFLVAGCASPEVNRVGVSFDAEKYTLDLDSCRGGTFIEASVNGRVNPDHQGGVKLDHLL